MCQTGIQVALWLSLCGWANPAAKLPLLDPVTARVVYGETMLVLVTEEGAAAVIFHAADNGDLSYDYRFESKDGTRTDTGTSPLSVRKDANGRYVGEQFIKAGPIAIEWSQGDRKGGWIYYSPDSVRVHPALAKQFAKLDLRRFMK